MMSRDVILSLHPRQVPSSQRNLSLHPASLSLPMPSLASPARSASAQIALFLAPRRSEGCALTRLFATQPSQTLESSARASAEIALFCAITPFLATLARFMGGGGVSTTSRIEDQNETRIA